MKENLKKIGKYLFVAFLFLYAFTMVEHALHLDLNISNIVLFALGLVLALFAHAKQNYITVILLLVHMSIEWFEWSQTEFILSTFLFSLGHVAMDFIFLSHELSVHMKKHKTKILAFTSVFLVLLFIVGKFFLSGIAGIEPIVELFEPFVMAGVLGCVSSHLFYHLKRFKKKEKCC